MTLANTYSISVSHQRSVRIDSDLTSAFFDGFIYHGTAQNTLETLIREFSQKGQSSYTLTGSYGSGKSTLALLLMGLLDHNKKIRQAANSVLNEESLQLVREGIHYKKGWLQIRSVGGVKNPIETFWDATLIALKEHPNTKNAFKNYQSVALFDENALIKTWKQLFVEIKDQVDGIFLIADEMGKTLEYINRNGGQLHLFQDLPEINGRLNVPFLFLGLLHQSFSEYTKDRGAKLQEEWGKIQGRYTDLHYNVSTDETVALIGKSIHSKADKINEKVVEQTLSAINDTKEREQLLRPRLSQCLPLHPLVALLLGPIAKRRFSQNERSTFAFLNSYELHGLQLFLKTTTDPTKLYTLANLWDFLDVNLEHTILSSPDAHAWAEASEVVNRAPDEETTQQLIKSIALINLFGSAATLFATKEILMAAIGLENEIIFAEHLQKLVESSCIVFRKHKSTWEIFEGSDIDISAELAKKIEQLADSFEPIENITYSNQVVAKKHYHKSGTLRWAELNIYISLEKLESDLAKLKQKRKGSFANFVLLLNKSKKAELVEYTQKHSDIAVAIACNADDIKAYAAELYALELLKTEKNFGGSLQHDKVAAREFTSRFNDATKLLWTSIDESFRESTWYYHNSKTNTKTLSQIATDLADTKYERTLDILNELVNRNKLSGTAVAARKKLLEAMVENEKSDRLAIAGYPPEASMYISCLKNTGLHSFIDDEWRFSTKNVSPELNDLFKATDKLIKDDRAGEFVSFVDIEKIWFEPPYGVTQGVAPILQLAYLKSLGNEIAFYEQNLNGQMAFIEKPDIDYVHKIQKNSKGLAVKYIVLNKKETQWLQSLASFAEGFTTNSISDDLLSVVSFFVTIMHNLSHWVRNANNFHEDHETNKLILKVRDLFLQANDPYQTLIKSLPSILATEKKISNKEAIERLKFCLKILMEKHEIMLSKLDERIRAIFPYESNQLIEMCNFVEQRAANSRLKAFARELGRSRISTSKHNNWLESLISIAIGRSVNSWSENALLDAHNKINSYAQKFLHLIKLTASNANNALTTKTISLLVEDDNGKFINYQKEILLSDPQKINNQMNTIVQQLEELNDFERIEVLHNLLKQALETQG